MTMKYVFVVIAILLNAGTIRADSPKTDIRLEYRETRMGKPPRRSVVCDLQITNGRRKPVWIVYPHNAEDRLPEGGKIKVSYWKRELFPAAGFGIENGYWKRNPNNVGRFVRIHSLAGDADNDRFYAICLPAGGEFRFSEYGFPAWKNVDSIQFWVAEDIVVNDQTSFIEWFPFDVIASDRVVMQAGARLNHNMNWNRSDLREGPVHELCINVLQQHVIPLRLANSDK